MMCDQNEKYDHCSCEDPKIQFMLTEYKGMAKALGDLHVVLLRMMNYFLIVVAVPISVVTIFIEAGNGKVYIDDLPRIVVLLFFMISVTGIVFSFILINVRMGMLRYARAISLIRKFFIEYQKPTVDISPYLYMPTDEKEIKYYMKYRFLFWQVILIAFFDGVYLTIVLENIGICNWCISSVIGFLYLLSHLFAYKIIAERRQETDDKKFNERLKATANTSDAQTSGNGS